MTLSGHLSPEKKHDAGLPESAFPSAARTLAACFLALVPAGNAQGAEEPHPGKEINPPAGVLSPASLPRVPEAAQPLTPQLDAETERKLETLIPLLKSLDPAVRAKAVQDLAVIGPAVDWVAYDIAELIVDQDQRVLAEVRDALLSLGKKSTDTETNTVVSAVVPYLDHDLEIIRKRAGFLLSNIGAEKAIKGMFMELHISKESAEHYADWVNVLTGFGAEGVPFIIDQLSTLSQADRGIAYMTFIRLGPKANGAVKAILEDASVLENMSSGYVPGTIPAWSFGLGPPPTPEADACAVIKAIGPSTIPELIKIIEDPDEEYLHTNALQALVLLDEGAKGALPRLLQMLEGTDFTQATLAAQIIGGMGPGGKDAVPQLIAVIQGSAPDPQPMSGFGSATPLPSDNLSHPLSMENLRQEINAQLLKPICVEALGRIGPGAATAVPLLLELLEGKNSELAATAAVALGGIGSEAEKVVPALLSALVGKGPTVRGSAALSLGSFPGTDEIIQALAHLVATDEFVASEGVAALAKIGAPARAAKTALVNRVATEAVPNLRAQAAQAVAAVDPGSADTVDFLRTHLGNGYTIVRRVCVYELGEIGAKAAPAIPDLLRLLDNPGLLDPIGAMQADPKAQAALQIQSSQLRAGIMAPLSPAVLKEHATFIKAALDKIDPAWGDSYKNNNVHKPQ